MSTDIEKTNDSRFHVYDQHAGEIGYSCMYSNNIKVEGDGLAYPELNIIRAILLSGINVTVLALNRSMHVQPEVLNMEILILHFFAVILNILRIAISILVLVLEALAVPMRFVVGILLFRLTAPLGIGHAYSFAIAAASWYHDTVIPYVQDTMSTNGDDTVIRNFKITAIEDESMSITVRNAGMLGKVWCCTMRSPEQASILGAHFRLQQRAGTGPEAVAVKGSCVFVSQWMSMSLSGLYFWRTKQTWWRMLDVTTNEWRKTVIDFESDYCDKVREPCRRVVRLLPAYYVRFVERVVHNRLMDALIPSYITQLLTWISPMQLFYAESEDSSDLQNGNLPVIRQDVAIPVTAARVEVNPNREQTAESQQSIQAPSTNPAGLPGTQAPESADGAESSTRDDFTVSEEDVGPFSTLKELEELYNSPKGWNKYPHMRRCESKVKVVRNDRRVLGHVIAACWSLFLYLQFRDPTVGIFGIPISLNQLLLANYAFITAYAAQNFTGPLVDTVEAKSGRYGVIVTRAIDRGFVRGFHVPHGDWLGYKNGPANHPHHEVKALDVSLTCNSIVDGTGDTRRIMVMGYNYAQSIQALEQRRYEHRELAWIGD